MAWDPSWDWDAGYTCNEDVNKAVAYMAEAKRDAAATESAGRSAPRGRQR